MQEEVTQGAVTLIVDGAKMSEQVLERALQKYLEAQKNKHPAIHRGKQTLKQLASQNAGLANIEITDKNIKAFTHVAKKYHVDFALKKDTTAEQPRYPLQRRDGVQVTAREIRTRTRYAACVATNATTGAFRLLGKLCDSLRGATLPAIDGTAPAG